MGYTEKTVLFRGLDFDSGRNSNHSSGGVAGTGSINPTNDTPNTQNNSATKVFKESFLNTTSAILIITKNGGVLPTNLEQLLVFQNGQEMVASQFTVSGSNITIDVNSHYNGANYTVFFIMI